VELSATTAVARADGRTLNVVSGTATPSICLAGSARKRPRSVSGSASTGTRWATAGASRRRSSRPTKQPA